MKKKPFTICKIIVLVTYWVIFFTNAITKVQYSLSKKRKGKEQHLSFLAALLIYLVKNKLIRTFPKQQVCLK